MRNHDRVSGMKDGRQAFTLIELLVVIGIIAVIISILIPVMSKARDSARNLICMSNLRQVTMVAIGYAIENRQAMLMASEDTTVPADLRIPAWNTFITSTRYRTIRYAPAAMLCPSGNGGQGWLADPPGPRFQYQTHTNSTVHYAINASLNRFSRRNDQWQSAAVGGRITWGNIRGLGGHSSRVMAFSEARGEWLGSGWGNGHGLMFKHMRNTRINLSFWDGHVESWSEKMARTAPVNLLFSGGYTGVQPWQPPS